MFHNFLSCWKDSVSIFIPRRFAQFLRAAFALFKESFPAFLKKYWPLLIVFVVYLNMIDIFGFERAKPFTFFDYQFMKFFRYAITIGDIILALILTGIVGSIATSTKKHSWVQLAIVFLLWLFYMSFYGNYFLVRLFIIGPFLLSAIFLAIDGYYDFETTLAKIYAGILNAWYYLPFFIIGAALYVVAESYAFRISLLLRYFIPGQFYSLLAGVIELLLGYFALCCVYTFIKYSFEQNK